MVKAMVFPVVMYGCEKVNRLLYMRLGLRREVWAGDIFW